MEQLEMNFRPRYDLLEHLPGKLENEGLSKKTYTTNAAVKVLARCTASSKLIECLLENEDRVISQLPKYPTNRIDCYYQEGFNIKDSFFSKRRT